MSSEIWRRKSNEQNRLHQWPWYKFSNITEGTQWSQRTRKYKLHYSEVRGDVLRLQNGTCTKAHVLLMQKTIKILIDVRIPYRKKNSYGEKKKTKKKKTKKKKKNSCMLIPDVYFYYLYFSSRYQLYMHTIFNITKTCLYNFDPLKPHFYIVKPGFTGVYIIFLISAQKHRLWVLVRTASPRRF